MNYHAVRALGMAFFMSGAALSRLGGQSTVDRTPNLDNGWTVSPGVVQFNFLHRFEVSAPPARKVTSFPNFHLATGLPLRANLGLDYATNSTVFSGIPNEYQLSLRRPVVNQSGGAPLDATLTAGYNFSPRSVDGELDLARTIGRLKLLGTVRGMSNAYDAQQSVWGLGGGARVRITNWLSVGGDVFDLVNVDDSATATPAWGAAVELRIPYSPHSLSIQITNTQSASIEGSSRGVRGAHMVGFEFTIPFTLSRYFGRRARPASQPVAPSPAARGDSGQAAGPSAATGVTVVRIVNLSFGAAEIRVKPGGRVRWVNGDQVQHSITADDGTFDSGLLEPGATFERVFAEAGTVSYHCTPHPFMRSRVMVGQ